MAGRRRALSRCAVLVGVLDFDGFDNVTYAKLAHNVEALYRLTEHGVAGVEERLGAQAQIELGAGRIRILRTMASVPSRCLLLGLVVYSS